MAVIINTAHKHVGLFGADPYGVVMHGFASGNYAGGILPTELSADWCNQVQQEINIACISGLPFSLDPSDSAQLAYAIDNQNVQRYPRWTYSPINEFRTQSNDALSTNGRLCVRFQRSGHNPSLAAGAASNNVLIFPVPTNTQNLVRFGAVCTQTDLGSNYGNTEWRASVRNIGGVVTLQNSTASYSDISLAGLTYSVVVVGANVVFRLAVPAAPAGKIHNCFAYGEMISVRMTP
jgi:hypothetical protein